MAGSLFERLTGANAACGLEEDDSIRNHLLRMFIARQGSVQSLPDYGLPDLNDLTLSRTDLINATCKGIKECITAYEPRLVNVEVTHSPLPDSTFSMGLHITAEALDEYGNTRPWHWDVRLEGDKLRGR